MYDPNELRDEKGRWTEDVNKLNISEKAKKDMLDNLLMEKNTKIKSLINEEEKLGIREVNKNELNFRDFKDTKKEFIAQRTIYVNSIDELDYNNLGSHFSKDLNYIHQGGGSVGLTDFNKNYKLRVLAKIKEDDILKDATKISNSNFKKETEVVLKPGKNINIEIEVSKNTGYDEKYNEVNWLPQNKAYKGKANTGKRYDEWVKKYL